MNINVREIDLSEWELAGEGNQGESYNHKSDGGKMLKLFMDFFLKKLVVEEYELAKEIQSLGIPSPAALEMVKVGKRYGIVFQRIVNKKSLCRIAGEQPERIPELAERLASAGKLIHSIKAEGTGFPRTIDYYRGLITPEKPLDDHERARMQDALKAVEKEDMDVIVHGDFHFGNVITDGEKDYFIDLGTISLGNPKWDDSMLFIMCYILPDFMIEHIFHMTKANAMEFWKEFKKAYFGPDAPSDEAFLKECAPYIYLRTLFFPDFQVEACRLFRAAVDNLF